jgi:hypothetical protein
LILVILWISLACLTLTGAPSTATQKASSVSSTATRESSTASAEINVDFGPGTFDFPDTKAGLADLTSYKASLTLSFDGTRDGKVQKWSKNYVLLSAKEPATIQLTIVKTGDLANLESVFMAEAGGADYERRGEKACTANVIESGNSLSNRLEPAGFLTFVIGAEAAGSETVNATAANHYTFDERASGQSGLVKSTGEVWVASEGGYIVKYLLTTKGNADYFGEGIEGILTLDYELTDVNQPVTFKLPDDCPAGLVNAPLLQDASNVLNMPGMLTYDTSTSLTDIVAFYQKEIPNMGWKLVGDPTITEKAALMEFKQGNKTMSIILTADDYGTTVDVVLGNAQE